MASAAVLLLAGLAAYPFVLERYWIRELRRLEAAEAQGSAERLTGLASGVALTAAIHRLGELRSTRAAPDLLRIAGGLWLRLSTHSPWKGDFDPQLTAFVTLQALPEIDALLLHHAEQTEAAAERKAAVTLLGARGAREAIPYLQWLDETDPALGPIAAVSLAQLFPSVEIEKALQGKRGFEITLRFTNLTLHELHCGPWHRENEHSTNDRIPQAPNIPDEVVGPGEICRFASALGGSVEAPFRLSAEIFSHETTGAGIHLRNCGLVRSPEILPQADRFR